jgi:hypothetical protein
MARTDDYSALDELHATGSKNEPDSYSRSLWRKPQSDTIAVKTTPTRMTNIGDVIGEI